MESAPNFGKRFVLALLSASLAFVPIYVWAAASSLSRTDVQADLGRWAASALTLFVICEAIMVVAIFLIAFPVEKWLVKVKDSALKSASKYFLIGFTLTLADLLLVYTQIASNAAWGWWPIYLLFGSILGTYTACVGRLIYPRMLKMFSNQKNEKIKLT